MSSLRILPAEEWRTFFDGMSNALIGKLAEIEVAALDLGDQVAVDWVPLLGLTYDPPDDLIEVRLDRAGHTIAHPKQILLEETGAGLAGVVIVDAEDARQIIRLKDPLMLSAPASGGRAPRSS